MREMIVSGISVDPDSKSPVMILRDKAGGRILPIWIGPAEAGAISVAINRVPVPRPLTHDLMLTVLHSLNVALTAVRITAVRGGAFYAEIDLKAHGFPLTIDCRPSDAVALALRAGAPVYAAEGVLDEAGREAHESGLWESEYLLLQDNPFEEFLPGAGAGMGTDKDTSREEDAPPKLADKGQVKTIVLSDAESEDFLGKLLRALEPESKYKM